MLTEKAGADFCHVADGLLMCMLSSADSMDTRVNCIILSCIVPEATRMIHLAHAGKLTL